MPLRSIRSFVRASSVLVGNPLGKGAPGGFQAYPLVFSEHAGQDSKLLRFALPPGENLGGLGRTSPTGVKVLLPGTKIEKSYSPVSHPAVIGHADFLVKAYPPREGGGLGSYLCSMAVGESALMKVKGPSFSLIGGAPLVSGRWRNLVLLACGTGLAPLFQVAVQLLNDPADNTNISLIFVNRSEENILMRPRLDELAAVHTDRFKVVHVLTQPSGCWTGYCGRPDANMLQQQLPPPAHDTMVLVCGTDGFVETIAGPITRVITDSGKKKKMQGPLGGLLAELGYSAPMVHKY